MFRYYSTEDYNVYSNSYSPMDNTVHIHASEDNRLAFIK